MLLKQMKIRLQKYIQIFGKLGTIFVLFKTHKYFDSIKMLQEGRKSKRM